MVVSLKEDSKRECCFFFYICDYVSYVENKWDLRYLKCFDIYVE